uniref:Uncharacterized protein n=1 Tax=Timema shepardi TaxID=629360 RepID=A0A7R9BB81_TIMSH|nr:unnamed protein product [Timema shepardi]
MDIHSCSTPTGPRVAIPWSWSTTTIYTSGPPPGVDRAIESPIPLFQG